MKRLRRIAVVSVSVLALGAGVVGVYDAIHSPLFLVQVVEVADQTDDAPVDAQTISSLAAVPLGMVNLFDLNLKSVERRLLVNPWISEVHLQKRFPQTLSISVVYREPIALVQNPDGNVSYVDPRGVVFGQINLMLHPDLPFLVGFSKDSPELLTEAVKVLDFWRKSSLGASSQVSQLSWDEERGYRALVSYALRNGGVGRTMVDLGAGSDDFLTAQFARLSKVFQYLGDHSVVTRQVWADAGKKIVVKTARGS